MILHMHSIKLRSLQAAVAPHCSTYFIREMREENTVTRAPWWLCEITAWLHSSTSPPEWFVCKRKSNTR
jgi:hypothetical protein